MKNIHIIPTDKREPCNNCNNEVCCCIIRTQETVEEAMERYLDSPTPHSYKLAVEFGAKWQQERSYSEEDLQEAFIAGEARWGCNGEIEHEPNFNEWYEQFKKK